MQAQLLDGAGADFGAAGAGVAAAVDPDALSDEPDATLPDESPGDPALAVSELVVDDFPPRLSVL